eukprot:11176643-Lingulodinium_polyedra.AAC.1
MTPRGRTTSVGGGGPPRRPTPPFLKPRRYVSTAPAVTQLHWWTDRLPGAKCRKIYMAELYCNLL